MVQNSQCHIQCTSHAFYYTAQICVWQGLEIKEEKNFKSTPGDTASWSFEKYYYFNGTLLCTLLTKTSIMCSNDIFILTNIYLSLWQADQISPCPVHHRLDYFNPQQVEPVTTWNKLWRSCLFYLHQFAWNLLCRAILSSDINNQVLSVLLTTILTVQFA